jgi:hypothetical protein
MNFTCVPPIAVTLPLAQNLPGTPARAQNDSLRTRESGKVETSGMGGQTVFVCRSMPAQEALPPQVSVRVLERPGGYPGCKPSR